MDMLGRLALAIHVKRQEQLYSPEAGAASGAGSCGAAHQLSTGSLTLSEPCDNPDLLSWV